MYVLYRTLTSLAAPLVPAYLRLRMKRGKEDPARLPERFGKASRPRPPGKLFWIHAASIGEATAALPLIDALLALPAPPAILITTVTVTSAALMRDRLPPPVIHQFAPVDTPAAVTAFLSHWRPDIALWVDSEFWPNLIMETHKRGTLMGIINARMSERSFRTWHKAPSLVRELFASFSFCFAQSEGDMERLSALGMTMVSFAGNLKYDASPLPCDSQELTKLKAEIGARPVWLAASTHPGEEEIIARVHAALKKKFPGLLTVIVPRHADRGDSIASELASFNVSRRARRQSVTPATDIYLADTMGELGLFYRLASVSFIGGSLVEHGGQNPIEPVRLDSVILFGPHTQNFAGIYGGLVKAGGSIRVQDEHALGVAVGALLSHPERIRDHAEKARAYVASQSGQVERIMNELQPHLTSITS